MAQVDSSGSPNGVTNYKAGRWTDKHAMGTRKSAVKAASILTQIFSVRSRKDAKTQSGDSAKTPKRTSLNSRSSKHLTRHPAIPDTYLLTSTFQPPMVAAINPLLPSENCWIKIRHTSPDRDAQKSQLKRVMPFSPEISAPKRRLTFTDKSPEIPALPRRPIRAVLQPSPTPAISKTEPEKRRLVVSPKKVPVPPDSSCSFFDGAEEKAVGLQMAKKVPEKRVIPRRPVHAAPQQSPAPPIPKAKPEKKRLTVPAKKMRDSPHFDCSSYNGRPEKEDGLQAATKMPEKSVISRRLVRAAPQPCPLPPVSNAKPEKKRVALPTKKLPDSPDSGCLSSDGTQEKEDGLQMAKKVPEKSIVSRRPIRAAPQASRYRRSTPASVTVSAGKKSLMLPVKKVLDSPDSGCVSDVSAGKGRNQHKCDRPREKSPVKRNTAKFALERILGCTRKGQKICYLIKWHGVSAAYNSWEDEAGITGSAQLIDAFTKQYGKVSAANPSILTAEGMAWKLGLQ